MKEAPEQPAGNLAPAQWGSDVIAAMLRQLDVRHVALNPGSSFRGLHDSLVNHLGNRDPQMLLCLHEEHAVSIAHGWARVTGTPMAVILHANVGLMHAAMALYNAWCDRVPMLVFGATGPVDAAARRPWIDWLHTSRDQAALVRPYVKWDDQPASLAASLQAMVRADAITRTAPHAPVYVCFDVTVQEAPLEAGAPALPDPVRHAPPCPADPPQDAVADLAARLAAAHAPVLLMGRCSRDEADWMRRIALAERTGARVVTDIKTAAAFPTDHPLHAGAPGYFLSEGGAEALRAADLVVAFDWVDPAGTLAQAAAAPEFVALVGLDHLLHNGWSLDHQALSPSDLHIAAAPDRAVAALVEALGAEGPGSCEAPPVEPSAEAPVPTGEMDVRGLAAALRAGLGGEHVSLLRVPLGWDGASWPFRHPLDYLGFDGGAGIGSGPGMAVGMAMALHSSGRLPVAVLGDGDYMMGASALWTAARYGVPLLIVVANNRSFFNDEIHQERVARERARPVENRWIGQRIGGPDIDIAAIARAQGLDAYGPVEDASELAELLPDAAAAVREGAAVVIDARIAGGYSAAMTRGMTDTAQG